MVSTGSINASNVCSQDSGDEGIPVSIHVTNNIAAGGTVDQGVVGGSADGHGSGQAEVHKFLASKVCIVAPNLDPNLIFFY